MEGDFRHDISTIGREDVSVVSSVSTLTYNNNNPSGVFVDEPYSPRANSRACICYGMLSLCIVAATAFSITFMLSQANSGPQTGVSSLALQPTAMPTPSPRTNTKLAYHAISWGVVVGDDCTSTIDQLEPVQLEVYCNQEPATVWEVRHARCSDTAKCQLDEGAQKGFVIITCPSAESIVLARLNSKASDGCKSATFVSKAQLCGSVAVPDVTCVGESVAFTTQGEEVVTDIVFDVSAEAREGTKQNYTDEFFEWFLGLFGGLEGDQDEGGGVRRRLQEAGRVAESYCHELCDKECESKTIESVSSNQVMLCGHDEGVDMWDVVHSNMKPQHFVDYISKKL